MKERKEAVTLHGNPFTLIGDELEVGAKAPPFTVLDNDLQPVSEKVFENKATVLLTVPSLDTPVCDTEVRRFNKEVAGLSEKAQVLTVSVDLPFAQKRWCGAAGIDRVTTLSDHRDVKLGENWGVLIKELRLLARAVFVIDGEGTIRHVELVPEIGDEPNYEEALSVVKRYV